MFRIMTLVFCLVCSTVVHSAMSWNYPLHSKNDIDQEIFAAEVSHHHQLLSGKIRLTWQRNDLDELASELKIRLGEKGIADHDIVMDKNISAQNDGALITAILERYQVPYPCNYHRQSYKIKDSDRTGCALENNLSMHLVDKGKVVF